MCTRAECLLVGVTRLVVPLLAAGCFQGQRVIKVNANGSGTIVDTVTLTDEARSMIEGLKANLAPEGGKKPGAGDEKTATERSSGRGRRRWARG